MNDKFCKKNIDKFQNISFDIFDTLIERKVNKPSDIFYLAGVAVLGKESAETFRLMRINAELLARKRNSFKEIKLNQIYDILKDKYGQKIYELKEAEIKMELESCYIRKEIYELLYFAKFKNKKVFLISDMYLPKQIMERLLKICGVDLYDDLYVSNEYGFTKLDGSLFRYVINEQKIAPRELLHIGDSVKADFLGAKKAGVNTILIHRKNRWKRIFT